MPKKDRHAPDAQDYLKMVGSRVRALRARRGMSRKILARDSGVSERYLGQLESGQGNISINLLRQVAVAMSISTVELLAEEPDRPFEQKMIMHLLERLNEQQIDEVHKILVERFPVVADENRTKRIALIGLRGAGKTTLGQKLAKQRDVPFIDLAQEIESLSGMSLGEIFSLYGQSAYRRYEHQALEQVLSNHREAIIETGGSIVSEPSSLGLLFECCTTVWVKTSAEEHISRVVAQGDKRPFVGPDHQVTEDLRQILVERSPLYAKAQFEIDTTGKTVEQSFGELRDMISLS